MTTQRIVEGPTVAQDSAHCTDYRIGPEQLPLLLEVEALPAGSCARAAAMNDYLMLWFNRDHSEQPIYDFSIVYLSRAQVFLRVRWFETVDDLVSALGSRFAGAIPHDRPFAPELAEGDEAGARIVELVTAAQQQVLSEYESAKAELARRHDPGLYPDPDATRKH